MADLRVCLIGCGDAGQLHLDAYTESPYSIELFICDSNVELVRELALTSGAKGWSSDYNAVLCNERFDIVDICLPNYLHGEVGLVALRYGSHLLVEKPFATSLTDVDLLIEEAKRANRKLMVSMNYRFLPEYQRARAFTDEGALGKIFWIQANAMGRYSPKGWRLSREYTGGGTLMEWGIHSIHNLNWFSNTLPQSVFARMHSETHENMEGEDSAFLLIDYGAELTGSLNNGYGVVTVPDMMPEFLVCGTKGSLWIDNNGLWFRSRANRKEPPALLSNRTSYAESVKASVHHYLECVTTEQIPLVTCEMARVDIEVAIAAARSHVLEEKVALH